MVEDGVDAGGDVVGDARDVVEDVEQLHHRRVRGVPVQGHQPLRLVGREAQEEGDHNCHCEEERTWLGVVAVVRGETKHLVEDVDVLLRGEQRRGEQ